MSPILIQMAERQWTLHALHLACAVSRNQGDAIVLLRLINVDHLSYLGANFGDYPLNATEINDLNEYLATAEDYGVQLTMQPMQCTDPVEAMAQAAQFLRAGIIFAYIPPQPWRWLAQVKEWLLQRRFAQGGGQLFTLLPDPQHPEQPLTISVKAQHPAADLSLLPHS
jgi:hypothetical protein